MQVDGLGERPIVDSGGFPVVWIGDAGCTVGQDPSQGGTNCYGPGDVFFDADTGAQYQLGSDWHLRTLGDAPSSSAPPPEAAPSIVDHFYYVDSGHIIEKTSYSDGSSVFNDTGLTSPLGDGATAGDPYSLQQTTPSQGAPDGFNTPNPVGGYGPYATPDPPRLTDLGTYVDGGRIIDHQVDQYGNDYYTDVGAAPTPALPSVPPRQSPAPSVPSPRSTPPSVGGGAPPITTHAAPLPGTAPEPVAADGQRLSGQSGITQAAYRAIYGANAANEWVRQHNAAIGAPQSAAAPTLPVPTGQAPGPSGAGQSGGARPPSTTVPTRPGTTPAITPTGNPTQFGHQVVNWLTRADFIGGVPNGLLTVAGFVGYRMLRQRGVFR